VFITYEGLEKLVAGGDIETSWLGIGLTIATLAICQPLGLAKRRLGARLGSLATVGEGTQNLLCGYMAVAVLVGLLANTLFGIWWLIRSWPSASPASPCRRDARHCAARAADARPAE
jgi:divalent metal cation (Fe/Co/Zn/Cd) transporter